MGNFRLDNCRARSQTSGRYEDAISKIPVCCIRRNRDRCGRQLLPVYLPIVPTQDRIVLCGDWT